MIHLIESPNTQDPDYLFTSGGLVYNDTFDPWTDSSGSAWMRTRIGETVSLPRECLTLSETRLLIWRLCSLPRTDPHSKKAPKKTALPKPVKVPSSMKVF